MSDIQSITKLGNPGNAKRIGVLKSHKGFVQGIGSHNDAAQFGICCKGTRCTGKVKSMLCKTVFQ